MEENSSKKVIIVEGNEDKKKKNWTWGRYFSFTWKHKYWVLGFSILGTLAGLLGVKYGYNASKETASITFQACFPTIVNEETNKETYFDGDDFNLLSLVSKSNLEAVKASSSSFKGINIDEVLSKGAITISRVETTAEKENSNEPVYYVLSGNVSRLGGKNSSKDFITLLIENEKKRAEAALDAYKIESCFSSSFSSLYLPERNKQLLNQYNLLDKKYNYLLSYFGPSYYVDDNLTLSSSYSSFVSSHYDSSSFDISSLIYEMQANSYAYFEEGKQLEVASNYEIKGLNYIESAKEIAGKIDVVSDQIDSLSKSQSYIGSESELANKIIELTDQKANLQTSLGETLRELKYLGFESSSSVEITSLSTVEDMSSIVLSSGTGGVIQKLRETDETLFNAYKSKCDSYIARIEAMKEQLESETSTLEKHLKSLYLRYSDFYSIRNGAVLVSGGISSILGAFAGLVLLYILTSLICSGIEISKLNSTSKEEKQEKEERQ